jgi:CspA family cold shock protein
MFDNQQIKKMSRDQEFLDSLYSSGRLSARNCVLPVTTSGHAEGYFEHGKGPMAQYKGTVKWFNNAKGYGFLGREDGPDVFVHYSSIKLEGYKTLKEGDEVEFDVIQGTKGPQADQVTRTKSV